MSGAVYSGDDIGAIVMDIGSNTIRVGYAGEEFPRHDIPTQYAYYQDENTTKYNFGTLGLHAPHAGAEISTCLKDGMVDNWEIFELMMNYIFNSRLHTNPENHPIILSEPAWIIQTKREQMVELFFEKYNVPAVYLAKTPLLVGVANNRPTCLVVDAGLTHTTAVPLHDGILMAQAIVKSPAGSDFTLEQSRKMLSDKHVDLVPYYRVSSKEIVKPDEPAVWKERYYKATASWHNYMVKELLQDFQSTVLQVADAPYDEEVVKSIPAVHYEFPNGFHRDFGVERFKVVEPLFNLASRPSAGIQPSLDVSSLVTTSVGMCDVDTRPLMYANVVVTGGNSNIQGFTDRLTRDLQSKVPPSMRLKVISQNGSIDRRFSPWLGGAILASLGNFQSFWISRQEYDETGKAIVQNRC
ncbi:actin-like protein 6B isoform X2 [Atheta coriaria]|uniref:actin-like protein 6B isoform X2 n=1 Tax=Dalotia coriaria TaxID=877792 RepID=UPI0031F3D910